MLGIPYIDGGLMGNSFLYARSADESAVAPGWLGRWSVWGQTAVTRFTGAEGPLSLQGEVATATLGWDTSGKRWLAGVALSYSEGEGDYAQVSAGGGTVWSTLTNIAPFARYELNARTSLWGTLGYGAGRLSLMPQRAGALIETDLANAMVAFGGRTALTAPDGRAGGFELALVSDARMTSTRSDTVHNLKGATGRTSRLRLLLEGAGPIPLSNGAVLHPTLESGVRYDGGDAETGAGAELGLGLGLTAGRFSVHQVDARGLLAHDDAEYTEWGFSGTVRYDAAGGGRGLSMDAGSAWGATQSGVQTLWNARAGSGAVRDLPTDAAQRLSANLGYGLPGRRGRMLWTPYLGADSGSGQQALRLGVRLASGPNLEFAHRMTPLKASTQTAELRGSIRW